MKRLGLVWNNRARSLVWVKDGSVGAELLRCSLLRVGVISCGGTVGEAVFMKSQSLAAGMSLTASWAIP